MENSTIIGNYFPHFNLVTGKDDLRPVMQYVKVGRDFCVATDAHLLMYADTKEIFSENFVNAIPQDGIFIHGQDWAKMAKGQIIEWKNEDTIKIIHKKKRPEIIEIFREIDGAYPRWESVIPMYCNTPIDTHIMGINFALAATLQKAMRSDNVAFNAQAQNRPILVCDYKGRHNTRGIIMPVRLEDQLAEDILTKHVE